jgi:hypothetical protein
MPINGETTLLHAECSVYAGQMEEFSVAGRAASNWIGKIWISSGTLTGKLLEISDKRTEQLKNN